MMQTNFVVLFFAALIGVVVGGGCAGSYPRQRFEFARQKSRLESLTMPCNTAEQLIRLPIPDGYERVTPAVYVVNRCSGHLCNEKKHCVATDVTLKDVVVIAKNGSRRECQTVQVEVHDECGCRCISGQDQCVNWQIFNEETCSCECPQGLASKCTRKGPHFSFNDEKCKCVNMSNGLEG